MSRFLLVFGLVCAVGNVAVAVDFVESKPKAGAPPNAAAVCSLMNQRRLDFLDHYTARRGFCAKRLDLVKKSGINTKAVKIWSADNQVFRSAASKKQAIADWEKRLKEEGERLDFICETPNYHGMLCVDLAVNQVGAIDEKAVIEEVLGPNSAIATVTLRRTHEERIDGMREFVSSMVPREVIITIDTTNLADGSKVELAETLLVSKTKRLGGSTYFVLEPINLSDYVEGAKIAP